MDGRARDHRPLLTVSPEGTKSLRNAANRPFAGPTRWRTTGGQNDDCRGRSVSPARIVRNAAHGFGGYRSGRRTGHGWRTSSHQWGGTPQWVKGDADRGSDGTPGGGRHEPGSGGVARRRARRDRRRAGVVRRHRVRQTVLITTATGYRYVIYDLVWHSDIRCDLGVEVTITGAESTVNQRYESKATPTLNDPSPYCSNYGMSGEITP